MAFERNYLRCLKVIKNLNGMIDSIYVEDHQHSCGARRWNQAISKTKEDLIRRLHLVVNKYGMPINFIVTNGSCADCKEAIHLSKTSRQS